MLKIIEKIVEPNKIFVGSIFKLKIKVNEVKLDDIKENFRYCNTFSCGDNSPGY